MNKQPEKEFLKLQKLYSSPETQQFLKLQENIAGYSLSSEDKEIFKIFWRYTNQPRPEFLKSWRSGEKSSKWYGALINGILCDTQNAFGAVLYHAENLKNIERELYECGEKLRDQVDFKNMMIGGGNTNKLDYEYQAFILAYRRCLDYWTRAMSAVFKQENHSFRKIKKDLVRFEDRQVYQRVIAIVDEYMKAFKFVLSNEDSKSVRDRVSHYESVPAGTLNINGFGVFLCGGGENLKGTDKKPLSDVLDAHIQNLRSFLKSSFEEFAVGCKLDEENGAFSLTNPQKSL